MVFLDKSHKEEMKELEEIWTSLEKLSKFAKERGVDDIFQDNGAKVVQQLVYLYLNNLPGREGNDATSRENEEIEWEMKSINLETSAKGFSTNHHLNHYILEKYRQVPWSFAIYHGITLESIYVISPKDLEGYFSKWEGVLDSGQAHINNPKISVKFVREHGTKVYPINFDEPIEPDSIIKEEENKKP